MKRPRRCIATTAGACTSIQVRKSTVLNSRSRARNARGWRCHGLQRAGELWPRLCLPRWRRQVGQKLLVGRSAHGRVLGGERAAADEVACALVARVGADPLPQQVENREIAMAGVDARAPQFEDLTAGGIEGREVEFALAVVAQPVAGALPGLQPISAHDAAVGRVLDDQVVADLVEGVSVQAGVVRLDQAFVEFEIEDLEAQRLRGSQVGTAGCQACRIGRCRLRVLCGRWGVCGVRHGRTCKLAGRVG